MSTAQHHGFPPHCPLPVSVVGHWPPLAPGRHWPGLHAFPHAFGAEPDDAQPLGSGSVFQTRPCRGSGAGLLLNTVPSWGHAELVAMDLDSLSVTSALR